MRTYDIIAIGELNVDLLLNHIEGFPEVGKEKFAGDMLLTLGSSTAIFAANVSALGSKTGFGGMIGRDSFGDQVKQSLREKGVDTRFVVESDTGATGATIILNYGEDRANVTYQGAMDLMHFADLDKELFSLTRHIHLSSLFMQSGLMQDIEELLVYAKSQGVTVSLDTQWDPAERWEFDYKKLLPMIDIFLPNEKELMALTRCSTRDDAIREVVPSLGNAMVVKRGSQGSLLVLRDGSTSTVEACLNSNVVDAIGAGDSFNAGFIHRFVQGHPLEACQYLGNITGAVNTTAAGGTGAFTSREAVIRTAQEVFGQTIEL